MIAHVHHVDPIDLHESLRDAALMTNAGRDAIFSQVLGTSTQPAAFNYVALTANTGTPAATDTSLAGEITTAGGGLIRKQATFAHTNGTTTATLTVTFTANGSDSLPVTVHKVGDFNASSSGTLGFTANLNADATFNASGDNMTLTDTHTYT